MKSKSHSAPLEQTDQLARERERPTTRKGTIKATGLEGICVSLVMAACWTTAMTVVRSTSAADAGYSRSRSSMNRNSTYADGVYKATGKYGSLPSSITVTITLAGDAITAVKVTPHATDPTSLDLQRRFAAAIPAVVVGKRIDEVKVGRLAGSSGTPDGFNAAVRRIKEQARHRADGVEVTPLRTQPGTSQPEISNERFDSDVVRTLRGDSSRG